MRVVTLRLLSHCKEVSRIITGGADDLLNIYFADTNLLFEFGDTRVVSRLIEGEYYKIAHMFTMDHNLIVTANRSELASCINRAKLLIQESNRKPIIVSIKDDNNLYIRLDTNLGSFNDNVEIKKDGGEIVIGFNPDFIVDALNVIDDEEVDIYMRDSKSPCLIRNADETYFYIILPININVDAY